MSELNLSLNPALGILELTEKFAAAQTDLILKHTDENNLYIQQLEDVKNLMAALNTDTIDNQGIDWTTSDAKRDLCYKVRQINPDLLPTGYKWNAKQIEKIRTNCTEETKTTLTKINPNLRLITQHAHNSDHVMQISERVIEEYRAGTRTFVSGQRVN